MGNSYTSAEMQSEYSTAPADRTSGHSLGKSYSYAEMHSMYSTTPAHWATMYSTTPARWATGHSLGKLQRCSQCILQPQPTGPPDTRWGSCRDAVDVFYRPSPLSHRTLVGEVAGMQSMYSTAPAHWATGHSLGELQRRSRCILQPQPTGPPDTRWGSYRDEVDVFYSPSRLHHA